MTSVVHTQPIRILLVDDHVVMRFGLRTLIEQQPGLRVVGEAARRDETLLLAAREQPDVVLLDLDLGDENGLDLIPALRTEASIPRVVVHTGLRDTAQHRKAVLLGAVGLVLKDQSFDILSQAIKQVHAGQAWLAPCLVAGVVTELSRGQGGEQANPEQAKIGTLTERESAVIKLVCEGLQNRAIAERLAISETTVRHHLTSIFGKLEVEHRLELLIYAFRHGLAPFPW